MHSGDIRSRPSSPRLDTYRVSAGARAMNSSLRRAATALWDNIGYVFIALALIFCLAHVFDPPRLNWGDSGSDFNVMGSGRNFAKYGFLRLRLTPFLLDPSVMTGEHDRVFIYTHYPQLPD